MTPDTEVRILKRTLAALCRRAGKPLTVAKRELASSKCDAVEIVVNTNGDIVVHANRPKPVNVNQLQMSLFYDEYR